MTTKRERNDFINFILDAERDLELTEEFLAIKATKDLYAFFQKKGYKDIPEHDCKDILTAKDSARGLHVPDFPRPRKPGFPRPRKDDTGRFPHPPGPCGPKCGY